MVKYERPITCGNELKSTTALGVAQIERRRDAVSIRFTEKATVDPERLARFVHAETGSQFTPAGVLKFALKEKQPEFILARLKALLEQLAGEEVIVGQVT